jgi:acyl-CoA reductase-like NAD-dependent aldehyde dehydrogenase
MKLAPGQYFRNTDTGGCLRRIKAATKADVDDLHEALVRESNSKRRRSKLRRALVKRIQELNPEGRI